jgi:hypothetical protein
MRCTSREVCLKPVLAGDRNVPHVLHVLLSVVPTRYRYVREGLLFFSGIPTFTCLCFRIVAEHHRYLQERYYAMHSRDDATFPKELVDVHVHAQISNPEVHEHNG